MKTENPQTDPIRELLKQHGTENPSEGFSLRLMNAVLTSYKMSYTKQYRKQERLGKVIIAVLIVSALLVFVELKPSAVVLEMVFPVVALAIGAAAITFMLRKTVKFARK